MKTWKSLILLGLVVLLNSCIIKSLQPFYITEHINYNSNFIGQWQDHEKGSWKILKFGNIRDKEVKHSDSTKRGKFEFSVKIDKV